MTSKRLLPFYYKFHQFTMFYQRSGKISLSTSLACFWVMAGILSTQSKSMLTQGQHPNSTQNGDWIKNLSLPLSFNTKYIVFPHFQEPPKSAWHSEHLVLQKFIEIFSRKIRSEKQITCISLSHAYSVRSHSNSVEWQQVKCLHLSTEVAS